jgi:LysR family hydrogen peroxide-inducible transcriptional activator
MLAYNESMISLKQIHYALAVEKTLHFKRAAEACNISQSALSTALSEMEKQLGFQVFERDNRKVLVTPLGRQLLDRARLIELQMQDLRKLAEAQKEPLSTPLTIGVIPTIGPYLLPRILPALEANYPRLKLDIVEDQTVEVLDLLRSGALDTAIIALPYACEDLLTFRFWSEDLLWVSHRDNKRAGHKAISVEDLQRENLMLLKDGHCLTDHALAACKLENRSNFSFSATSLATLLQLVVGKIGTTLVPEIALEQLVAGNDALTAVRLSEPGPHRELALVVRPNYPSIGNIEALRELTRAELARQIPDSRGGRVAAVR